MIEDEDEFTLEGYNDLNSDTDKDGEDDPDFDDGHRQGPKRKRAQPAFYNRTVIAAERGALRTQVKESEILILDEGDEFTSRSTSRVPGTFGRRSHGKGDTLAAYHKKVSAELDSDDELMLNMREKGFSDRQIADKLARDGRVRYDPKSIATRIGRVRQAQAAHVDWQLQEGYKEWEYQEDLNLLQAYDLADIEVNYEIERIRAWRFRKVSEYMRRLNKDTIISAKACRERYQALLDGTATIPSEEADDPAQRRVEMEAYREERAAIRDAERLANEEREKHKRRIREEARERNAQKAEETAARRQRKMDQKAQRATQRAAQAMLKQQRATENHNSKREINARLKEEKAAQLAAELKKKKESNPHKKLTVSSLANCKNVTPDTTDPRSYLSFNDLVALCADRGLSKDGRSKEEFVQRLRDADDEFSLNDLKKMCRTKGLNITGTKIHMKYMLAHAAAKRCASFALGLAEANGVNEQDVDGAGGGDGDGGDGDDEGGEDPGEEMIL
ncbi:hypothetical protein BDV95DRAFT_240490 [Massariosphaeria phaeospora]|uniref:DUF7626 domain-containing protein n=1 Tax=Massariosphaeria phaeospora TaxID=100035 RepID=A0A7C8HZ63_9PLEO|nr:hypothetical protein BDV95DRAFT_240490 [Massariosphaeria phaeospora]